MLKYTHLLFTIVILLFAGSCKKDVLQVHKVKKLNSNTTESLYNIRFIDNNKVFIAGGEKYNRSVVLRSVDGGNTWSADSYPQAAKAMYGFAVAPNGNIYLSGDGTLLYSADTGLTWQSANPGNWLFYNGIAFPVPDTGVLISSVLQRQSAITQIDANFNFIDEHTFQFGLNNIYMTSPSTGYVIGYGAVMKTTDHRRTWNFQDVKGDNFMAMDIHGNEIWMCGFNGSIFHTIDGGDHWDMLRNGNDITLPRYYTLDILFKDKYTGWAVCDDGKMIFTDDGGVHWAAYKHFTNSALRSIALCPNGDLLVAGDNGVLFRITL